MNISVETKKMLEILEVVSRISTKHITLPVLQCVYIEAQKNALILRATNLEIGIEMRCDAKVTEEGVIAVPASVLLQTLLLIHESTITFITEEQILHIETKSGTTEVKGIESTDFPIIPQVQGTPLSVSGPDMAFGIKTVAFTASQSSIKPELGCVYVYQKKEHTLTFVATDSFRLMERVVSARGVILNDALLIPHKNALEIARVIEGITEPVTLLVNENQCAFVTDTMYLTTRLINGTFPDYEQIIPKEYTTTATLLLQDFTQSLKRTGVFLNKFMQLGITFSEKSCTFSSQNNDTGTTTVSVPATKKGDDLTLNFNQRYITEAFPHMVSESVTLKCAGIGRPMVIVEEGNNSQRYLVMPMNK